MSLLFGIDALTPVLVIRFVFFTAIPVESPAPAGTLDCAKEVVMANIALSVKDAKIF